MVRLLKLKFSYKNHFNDKRAYKSKEVSNAYYFSNCQHFMARSANTQNVWLPYSLTYKTVCYRHENMHCLKIPL